MPQLHQVNIITIRTLQMTKLSFREMKSFAQLTNCLNDNESISTQDLRPADMFLTMLIYKIYLT